MYVLRASGFRRLFWILLPAILTAAAAPPPAPERVACQGPAVPLPQICGAKLRDPEISCALPATELDVWQGRTLVSLVGFRFLRTRVLGVPIRPA